MNESDTSILKNLSARVPRGYEKKKFSVFDISRGLSEFLTENFRGLAEVSSDINTSGYVVISAEHLAYLLKLILKQVNGKMFLSMHLSFDGKMLTLEIPFDEAIELSLPERASLCAAARGADLEINISPYGITLSAKSSSRAPAMFVYAGDTNRFKQALLDMFFGR